LDDLIEFAKWVLDNAGVLWKAAECDKQVRLEFDAICMASLVAASWNPLMERLKAIGSLRDLAVTSPYHNPLTGENPHK
jgi:hypothetical protein